MPQKCHSNLRIHSNGTRSNKQTMTSCPKKDVINANVTKSCITISHPGISFSRINRYSVPNVVGMSIEKLFDMWRNYEFLNFHETYFLKYKTETAKTVQRQLHILHNISSFRHFVISSLHFYWHAKDIREVLTMYILFTNTFCWDGRTRGGMAPQILTDHLPYYNQGKSYAHHSTTGIHNFFDLPPSLICVLHKGG